LLESVVEIWRIKISFFQNLVNLKRHFFPKNPFLGVEIIFFSLKEFENSPTRKPHYPQTVGKELLVAEDQGGI